MTLCSKILENVLMEAVETTFSGSPKEKETSSTDIAK